ncbi:CD1247 N-terminal domain-containing protein [uncultured Clostridium sp.]|uniref:CD1247 N-terminal domain-containing protein n=1 Tax=uncultured Clostridium sp. TaxID=59620 RepID=UPI0028EC9ED1|nr:CD1247 N-terminal domain-containing protein [uncultured Clostridium sp.]
MEELGKEVENFKKSLSKIENEEYKGYFNNISSILELMVAKIEELTINQETIEENMKFMDDDLSDIQDELFEELSIDELNDMEDEYKEINCVHCHKQIFIEQSALSNNEEIPCPYCNKNIKG